MARTILRNLAVLLVTVSCAAGPGGEGSAAASATRAAFTGVTALAMDGSTPVADRTVIIEDGRIAAVGGTESTPAPDGPLVIDGKRRYLLPGLAEMHGHVPPPSASARETEAVLFLYLANGITTVSGMLGAPGQLILRERANSGALDSPTLYLAGPSFNGSSVSTPAQAPFGEGNERTRAG